MTLYRDGEVSERTGAAVPLRVGTGARPPPGVWAHLPARKLQAASVVTVFIVASSPARPMGSPAAQLI